ncbi:hypothetical protein [Flavobacterium microcysteis]|uniref:PepSY domain-containing protein n=1 Tax=Flavobacterium microcysteis TaxID=2596891 RepID=A0A501QF21_9FLAO|nr:hypothetical protein [Flavobacterium microcysteis]TPD70717.1 hypothetical protein FJA49_07180 [Flavobacterium microcysteis]
MKKLLYLSILFLSLGIFTSFESVEVLKNDSFVQEKEYKKIAPEEVKKEAIINIKAKYGDYQIVEAAVALDGEYKLVLKKDNASITALFTSSGELIKIL